MAENDAALSNAKTIELRLTPDQLAGARAMLRRVSIHSENDGDVEIADDLLDMLT